MPRFTAPDDALERMVWLTSTAADAEPWLPTVAEQDAAWLAVFGDGDQQRKRNAHNARALNAMLGG